MEEYNSLKLILAFQTILGPELLDKNFILCLGGMHFLMSYVDAAVGGLMAGSGLEEVMKAAFWGCNKNANW